MISNEFKMKSELDAISAHLKPIFTVESKHILKRMGEDSLARLIHEHTGRPLRYCEMFVLRMSPMSIVATWRKLREMRAEVQEELVL